MKTRTLLLLALACGVAIMLAGAALLFQLSTQDDVEPPVAIGQLTQVADMRIAVDDVDESGGLLAVTIRIGGVADDDALGGFRLIASGRAVVPDVESSDCASTTVDVAACVLRFDVSTADGSSRVLFFERGDERARWVLA